MELIHHRVDRVLGDACEGYNPTHDVCRIIISAAVAHASRVLGLQITSLAFDLAKDPRAENDSGAAQVATKVLTDEQLERKLSAAQGYPELQSEVNAALDLWGSDGFRVETLREAGSIGCDDGLDVDEPIYEQFGRQRVATGQYARLIRRREHILPIAKALHRFATEQLG